MSIIKENDKVSVMRDGYEGRIGNVETALSGGVFVVKLDDGELIKCLHSELVAMKKEDEPTPDPMDQPITITRREFGDISAEVIAELSLKDRDPMFSMALGLTGVLVTAEIGKKLFIKKANND